MVRVRELVRRTNDELGTRLRMLVGKPGLDGHSNGAEQIAVRARDAGIEVVYQGIRLTPAQIASAAVEEGVHVVGLSILSGSHRELVPDVLRLLREAGAGDLPVIVGGIIPEADARWLQAPGRRRGLHAEGLRHHRDHRSYRRGRPRRSRPRLTSRRQKGLHLVLRPVTTALRHVAVDVRPLRHAAFRRLFVGQGVAFVGFQLTAVAVPVQMYAVTGSSFWVGLIGLAAFVPLVVFGLYGGSVSDAVDRRRLYLLSSLLVWAVTGALLAQALLQLDNPWLLLALVAVQSVGFALSSPVRGAILPRLLPVGQVPAANTLSFTMSSAGAVVGPLLAGLILARGGPTAAAYAVDAALFTVGLYAALRLPPLPPLGADHAAGAALGARRPRVHRRASRCC